ncbi:hypothetical protein [Polaromonas sp.]|uniref:hypothetical protein n=1 Tax=Polaromonas sp. TaxID=1869339 RepID=UPI00326376C8
MPTIPWDNAGPSTYTEHKQSASNQGRNSEAHDKRNVGVGDGRAQEQCNAEINGGPKNDHG